MMLTYEKGSNDLKVQGTGSDGLEELEEEFSDGRIQYAFVRVKDPNSGLPKFVQINWCGDGVPEVKKGLFHTHSSSVAKFFRNAHVVISARNESDVTSDVIMKRVEAASGAKYSVQKEAPRAVDPIAPVGSAYKPIGKVDMNALKRAPVAPPKAAAAPPQPGRTTSAASLYGKPPAAAVKKGPAPDDAWGEEEAAAPPPPPAVSRPAFSARPAGSAAAQIGRAHV